MSNRSSVLCKRSSNVYLKNILFLMFAYFITFPNKIYAAPWFTGPLLARAGITIPRGHTNLEIYGFDTKDIGAFDRHGKLIYTPASKSIQFNPLLSFGLTDWMDVQLSIPYAFNRKEGQSSHHIGDSFALLGFQLLRQDHFKWRPNLRISIQQIFPTGKYESLNPLNNGSDGTGLGSYQTNFSLNFQHLAGPWSNHYLRSRLILSYLYASSTNIYGLSSYGGALTTKGSIRPGNLASVDVSGEFTVTQSWVAVMEGYYIHRGKTSFYGNPGRTAQGLVPKIGHDTVSETSLAPAIEYNFNGHYGVIAGAWFSVKGKDAPNFQSAVVAFNAYW